MSIVTRYIPHRFDGETWTCLVCGRVSPDPCDCRCHNPKSAEPRPRTLEERLAFEREWDRRVEEGWAKNGRPPPPPPSRGGTPYPSIIGSRKPRPEKPHG